MDSLGLVGVTIDDKYVVEYAVGEGAFGIVYRATHKVWQTSVAIKVFKPLMGVPPEQRTRLVDDFMREGAILTELSARTASIVQARDVGTLTTPSGAWVPYMVLEWLQGSTLEDWLETNGVAPWPLERAMHLLEPIALALDVAHARGIAHRDIKPGNIFVVGEMHSDDMLVKLLDFGIAKVVLSASDLGLTLTSGEVTAFTPSYGAPEQFSRAHGATGPWTDVYALALILVELVTGRCALEGDDFLQLGVSSSDPMRRPTPRSFGVDCGDAVESVISRALTIAPRNRYQRAGELWSALRVAAGAPSLRPNSIGELRLPTPVDAPPSSSSLHAALQTSLQTRSQTPSPLVTTPPPSSSASRAITAGAQNQADRPAKTVLQGSSAGSLSPNVTEGAPARSRHRRTAFIAASIALGAIGITVFAIRHRDGKTRDGGSDATGLDSASVTANSSPSTSPSTATIRPACPAGMAEIPGGQFFMGSDEATADDDEKPAHNVTLSPYCMDRTEVTVAAYKACSDHGQCKRAHSDVSWPEITDEETKVYGPLCNVNDPLAKAKHPINCVDWEMADIYCSANQKRLPTEAEWEFAARGPDGRIYPWGDAPPDERHLNACGIECLAWAKLNDQPLRAMYQADDGFATTAPVGSFPMGASRYGLLDVVGNVWEWVGDWEAPYGAAAEKNPLGPASAKERVVRGGAWNGAFPSWVRPSQRYAFPPETKSFAVGFRCAASLPTGS